MEAWVLVLVLATPFVFGCLGCYVAAQKRRSVVEGAILGAMFGPLGPIVVGLLPDGGDGDDEADEDEDEEVDLRGLSNLE